MKRSSPILRKTPLKQKTFTPLVRVAIRPVSSKQSRRLKEYAKVRVAFLMENPTCAVHEKMHGQVKDAWHIHHKKGRLGPLLCDARHFLAVCPECHRWLTDNGKEAIRLGFSESRA